MSSIFTHILSLAHLFYAYFTHGPNKSASAQYDNTRGAWLTQEGCTITERKEGRKERASLEENARRTEDRSAWRERSCAAGAANVRTDDAD